MKSKAEDVFEKKYIKEDNKLTPIDYLIIGITAISIAAITCTIHLKVGAIG